jgi:hypothetical protein
MGLPKAVLKQMGYFAQGGLAKGIDTIPAMLAPGEFIMKPAAVKKYGTGLLSDINNGNFRMSTPSVSAPSYGIAAPETSSIRPIVSNSSNVDNSSVYNNTYSISVNAGNNSDSDSIARAVIGKIREMDSQRIRGVRV